MNLNDVIYFIHDLENTGKKRIDFLKIHKSWQIEKVISKGAVLFEQTVKAFQISYTFFNQD